MGRLSTSHVYTDVKHLVILYKREGPYVCDLCGHFFSGTWISLSHSSHNSSVTAGPLGASSFPTFKVLVLTFNAINGVGPSYLKDYISLFEVA